MLWIAKHFSILAFGFVFALSFPPAGAHAKTLRVLYSFCAKAGCADGNGPAAGVVADSAGNLYGTTEVGGGANACPVGCGVVFKLAPDGTESVLHVFTGAPDSEYPDSVLLLDLEGNLYGATPLGGSTNDGAVYKLAPDGTETVLYSFTGGSDGSGPAAGLIADAAGNLYGTTAAGGRTNECADFGCGTVFRLAPDGSETVLYSFCAKTDCTDGAQPFADLIADEAGNLYGTTQYGGTTRCIVGGCGTVFRLTPGGKEKVLYTFCSLANCADGEFPFAGLFADKQGNLYGTTGFGGANDSGVVFILAPHGAETVLYTFTGGSDGGEPQSGLIEDGKGNLYGTTVDGGSKCPLYGGCGTIYGLAGGGTLSVLASTGSPASGLLADKKGNLYGTTGRGGVHRKGQVFAIAATASP